MPILYTIFVENIRKMYRAEKDFSAAFGKNY